MDRVEYHDKRYEPGGLVNCGHLAPVGDGYVSGHS